MPPESAAPEARRRLDGSRPPATLHAAATPRLRVGDVVLFAGERGGAIRTYGRSS